MTGRILVTGASGFIGKHVVASLQTDPSQLVTCLVRKTSNLDGLDSKKLDFRDGDLTDRESVIKAMKGIAYVIHLGAAVGTESAEDNQKVNVEGTRHVIEACKLYAVRRIVFISSVNARLGIGSYGISKRDAEELFKGSGLNYTILRPGLVFGREGVQFRTFVKSIKDYPFIPLVGKGENLVQPIDVDDLAGVIAGLVKLRHPQHRLYEVGGRDRLTTRELLGRICAKLEISKPFLPVPVAMLRMAAAVLGKRSPVNKDQLSIMLNDLTADNRYLKRELHSQLMPLDSMIERYLEEA
jgi:NADH dehydrogenase